MNPYDPIRNELHEYRVPVDKEALWARTAHAIPDRRRKRPIFLWWSAGAVLVSAVGVLLFLRSQPVGPADAGQDPTGIERPGAKRMLEKGLTDGPIEEQRPAFNPSSPEAPIARIEDFESKVNPPSHSEPPAAIQSPTPETGIRPAALDHSVEYDRLPAPAQPTQVNPIATDEESSTLTYPNGQPYNHTYAARTSRMKDAGTAVDHPVSSPYVERIVAVTPFLPEREITRLPIGRDQGFDPANRWDVRRSRPTWFMTVMGGVGLSSWHMAPVPAEEQEAAALWSKNFRPLEFLTTSVQGGLRWPNRLETTLGIRYGRLVTEQDFTITAAERLEGKGTSGIIINENGETESVTGDVSYTRRTTIRALRFNTHQVLDLDLQLGFSLARFHRLEIAGWFRGSLTAWHQITGTAPNGDWLPAPIGHTIATQDPSSRFNWGAGLEARWHVVRHTSLQMRVGSDGLRYRLDRDGAPLAFQHRLYSLTLGVRYTP